MTYMYTYVYKHLFSFELKYRYGNPQHKVFLFVKLFWEERNSVAIGHYLSIRTYFIFWGLCLLYAKEIINMSEVCHWHSTFARVLIKSP